MNYSASRQRPLTRFLIPLAIFGLLAVGCTQEAGDLTAPAEQAVPVQDALNAAMAVQDRHTRDLLDRPGVVGTGVGLNAAGRPVITIFTQRPGVEGLPDRLEGLPVAVKVTGMFVALSDPTARFPRPVPTGVSTGHPAITAGTIGARVRDAAGNVYALSNNHVYANQNNANIGDAALQPGAYDGGQDPADRIGTLADFEPLDFSLSGQNVMDAAIALSTVAELGNSTPADGYGTPSPTTVPAYVGQGVQKFGRTTKLTHGTVSEINVTVEVCYEVMWVFCVKSAYFVDQIGVDGAGFSGGGDSGSLIVTDDANKNPVALLFAGSDTYTLGSPIDAILNRFNVTIDAAPATSLTDVGITDVSAPESALLGDMVDVSVTVRNVGNQDVTSDIVVTLHDDTEATVIASQTISGGLSAGATTTLSYSWDTQGASLGDHDLIASHDFADDNGGNDSGGATVTISETPPPPPPATGMHVGDLFPYVSNEGSTWTGYVIVRIENGEHSPVEGATVYGTWTGNGLAVDECTTDYAGECLMLSTLLSKKTKSVTFSVADVVYPDLAYEPSANHDADGDSDGTSITINR